MKIPELRYTEGLPESSNRVLAKGRWDSGTARVKFSAGRMTETLKIYPAPESRPRKYDVIVTVRDSKGKTAQDRASVEIRENLFLCPARDWDPARRAGTGRKTAMKKRQNMVATGWKSMVK